MHVAIIVGAGPVGSAAAYTLDEAGLRVLVLEKAVLPRYKPCGGGLSAALLAQFPFSFDPVIESSVQSVSYALGDRQVTVALPENQVFTVMRSAFDRHILDQARHEPGIPAIYVERYHRTAGLASHHSRKHGRQRPLSRSIAILAPPFFTIAA